MCMKGVFSLPVRMTVQRCEYWEPAPMKTDGARLTEYGKDALRKELLRQLGEEGILAAETYAAQNGADAVTVTVMAECLEDIGVEISVPKDELSRIREEAVND